MATLTPLDKLKDKRRLESIERKKSAKTAGTIAGIKDLDTTTDKVAALKNRGKKVLPGMGAGKITKRDEPVEPAALPKTETQELNERGEELFGKSEFMTEEEKAADIIQKEQTEQTLLDKSVNLQKNKMKIQVEQAAEVSRRSKAAAQSAFAEAKGGVQAGGQGIVSGFQRGLQASADIRNIGVQQEFDRLQSLQFQLKDFQEKRRKGLVGASVEQERAIQLEIAESEERKEKLQAEREERQADESKRMLDTITSLPEAAVGAMSAEAVGGIFEAAGMSYSMGVALQAASKTHAEEASEESAANLMKLKGEARTAGLSEAQKNLGFLSTLEASGASEEIIDNFKRLSGITEDSSFTTFKNGDDTYKINTKTGATEKVVDNSGSNNLIPTGQIVSGTFNNKPIRLDSAAMVGLSKVNEAMIAGGLGEFNSGAIASSSMRENQGQVIAQMADKFNIGYNDENPNETAEKLRGMGVSVANVGGSMHEKGLAVDVFPNPEYIEQIKPIMEKNGWKQTIPIDDAGHFEYQGVVEKKFTDSQKAILSTVDPNKTSSTTLAMLKSAGLSITDLGTFLATEKKQLSPEKKEETKVAKETLEGLLEMEGFNNAVGFAWQKFFLPFKEEGSFIGGTEAANFASEFKTFKSQLMVPLLSKLKGAMSDKDLKFLESAATSLDFSQTQEQFKKTANAMIDKMNEAVTEGSTTDLNLIVIPEIEVETKLQVIDTIQALREEGLSENEIDAEIINLGYDPQQFKNNNMPLEDLQKILGGAKAKADNPYLTRTDIESPVQPKGIIGKSLEVGGEILSDIKGGIAEKTSSEFERGAFTEFKGRKFQEQAAEDGGFLQNINGMRGSIDRIGGGARAALSPVTGTLEESVEGYIELAKLAKQGISNTDTFQKLSENDFVKNVVKTFKEGGTEAMKEIAPVVKAAKSIIDETPGLSGIADFLIAMGGAEVAAVGAPVVKSTLRKGAAIAEEGLEIAGAGIAGAGEVIGETLSAGKSKLFPEQSLDDIVLRITQGEKKTADKAIEALSLIEKKGIETFEDLGKATGDKIGVLSKAVDDKLLTDKSLRKLDDLARTVDVDGEKVTSNFVERGIKDLEDLYTKTGDDVGLAEMKAFKNKVNTEGVTLKEINDFARKHGTEFKNKAFKANGEPKEGISALSFENNRKGLKETVRQFLPDDATRELDRQMSTLFNVKSDVAKLQKKADSIRNRLEQRGLLRKAGAKVGEFLDIRGILKGFLSGDVKTLNAIKLEEELIKNLKKFDKILATKTDAELLNALK